MINTTRISVKSATDFIVDTVSYIYESLQKMQVNDEWDFCVTIVLNFSSYNGMWMYTSSIRYFGVWKLILDKCKNIFFLSVTLNLVVSCKSPCILTECIRFLRPFQQDGAQLHGGIRRTRRPNVGHVVPRLCGPRKDF